MTELLTSFLEQLRRDPKKAGVLVVLGMVLLLMWVRMRSGAPTPARAHDTGWSVNEKGVVEIPSLGELGVVMTEWRERPVADLSRNLFLSVQLPRDIEAPVVEQVPIYTAEDGRFWKRLEAALSSREDRERYRRDAIEQLMSSARGLTVTSIVSGPEGRVLINDTLVRPGDQFTTRGGTRFLVRGIEQRHVVLEHEGLRVAVYVGGRAPKLLGDG